MAVTKPPSAYSTRRQSRAPRTTPSGGSRACTGTPRSARAIASIHTGSASPPPLSRSPRLRGVSWPIQPTPTTPGAQPANQASTASLVVPVLP